MSNLSKIINKVVQKIINKSVNGVVLFFKTMSNLSKISCPENPGRNCCAAENDDILQGRKLDQFCAHHKTCCTVSPPITQLSASI